MIFVPENLLDFQGIFCLKNPVLKQRSRPSGFLDDRRVNPDPLTTNRDFENFDFQPDCQQHSHFGRSAENCGQ